MDHTLVTLDGKGTFYGMGIIECSIFNEPVPDKRIIRNATLDFTAKRSIKLQWYQQPEIRVLARTILTPIKDLRSKVPLKNIDLNIDLIWHTAGIFRKAERVGEKPNWNDFMKQISSGNIHPSKSNITMFPIIDLNPSDENCIYSTILHVIDQARQMNIVTPCITLDQPLWIKAVEIVLSKGLNVVVRLGGFHSLMSFVGSLGSCMLGSGLEQLLEKVYGKNTVNHMLTGKAISRGLRGHFLVDSALRMILLQSIFPKATVRFDERDETSLNKSADLSLMSSQLYQMKK